MDRVLLAILSFLVATVLCLQFGFLWDLRVRLDRFEAKLTQTQP